MNSQKKELINIFSAALLSMFIFLSGLHFLGILGNNNNSILFGDMAMQYIPFIRDFINSLTQSGANDCWYSFSQFLGTNTALTNAYYCLSPFNILYALDALPVPVITASIITIKIALAAAAFQFFSSRFLRATSAASVVFSCCYAIGGFTAAMYVNIMWLDALYILPVLTCLTLETAGHKPCGQKDVNDKDSGMHNVSARHALSIIIRLSLAYAYLFITNFYMAYMVGIFETAVFILALFTLPDNRGALLLAKKCLKYALSVMLAAGLSAFILCPAAFYLLSHGSADNEQFTGLTATVPDIFHAFFLGSFHSLTSNGPLLYCGIPTLLLLPIFFTQKSTRRRTKILTAILLTYYALCIFVLPLYMFMHAFDFPNWYPYRFTFCLCFILTAVSSYTFEHLKITRHRLYIIYTIVLIALYIAAIPSCINSGSMSPQNAYFLTIINGCLTSGYLFVFLFFEKIQRENLKKAAKGLFMIMLTAELIINMYYTGITRGSTPEETFSTWEQEGNFVRELKKQDSGLYRISIDNEINTNASSWFGYNGLNAFSSSDNYNLRIALHDLGISAPNRVIYDAGYTPVTYALMGTKYKISGKEFPHGFFTEKDELPAGISEYESVLPMIFMSDSNILDYTATDNPFENQNNLISRLCGSEQRLFTPVSPELISTGSFNMEIAADNDSIVFQKETDEYSEAYYSFIIPHNEEEIYYACFYQPQSMENPDTLQIICTLDGWWEQPELDRGGIVPFTAFNPQNAILFDGLDDNTAYDEVAICTLNQEVTYGTCKNLYFYSYSRDNSLKEACDDLNSTAPTITSFSSSDIRATADVKENRSVLFTTIPYDKGWKVYCDGNEIETFPLIEGAFLGANLPTGQHEIKIRFTAGGAKAGIIISTTSLIILVILIAASCVQKQRKSKEN